MYSTYNDPSLHRDIVLLEDQTNSIHAKGSSKCAMTGVGVQAIAYPVAHLWFRPLALSRCKENGGCN